MIIKKYLMCVIIALALVSCSGKPDTPAKPTATETPAVQQPKPKQIHSFGMTVDQFANNLNALKTKFVIKHLPAEKKDDLLHFSHSFNDKILLTGTANAKDKTLASLEMALSPGNGQGVDGMQDMLDVPTAMSVVTQALNPTIDKKEIGKAIMEMTGKAASEPGKMHAKTWNNNAYVIVFSKEFRAYGFKAQPLSAINDK